MFFAHHVFAIKFMCCFVFYFFQEKLGSVRKTWSDVANLNYWVVRDYYRLVNAVNALEPQIQRLTDDQVCGFQLVLQLTSLSFWLVLVFF